MRLMISLILLMCATTSSSYGYNVESVPEMVARELANVMCRKELKRYGMERLTPFLDLCRSDPTPFFYGINGFLKGLNNCQKDFRCHRWNCTTDEDHGFKLFGTGMARASRESAIMIAMVSAGIVEHVTNQLDQGKREMVKISKTDCMEINVRRPRNPAEYVSVHDCNADVVKGENQAKGMLDAWIQSLKASEKEIQMNEHNAAVGRMAVRLNMRKVCKCVGLSGACNSKLCFQTLQPLKESTNWLRRRYDRAQKVHASSRAKRDDGTRALVTVARSSTPNKDDLIYLLNSPNYCDYDTSTGSLGTRGRRCNICRRHGGFGTCEELCCGRGHQEYEEIHSRSCSCTFTNFIMECKTCKEKVTVYRCK